MSAGLCRVAIISAVLAGCGDNGIVIEDDWGPPAGFTVVEGTVRRANGTPASLINLSLGRCGNPIAEFLGYTTTDNQGRYRIEGQLGPVGLLPLPRLDPDTLRIRCFLVTGPPPLSLDSVDVRFWRERAAVVPLVRDLQFPP